MKEIKSQKLLLVEGKDEEVFFKILLEKKKIDGIQIISSAGKQRFKKRFPNIIKKTPGFDKVSSLAVIQDADESAEQAFQSIQSVLKNNAFTCFFEAVVKKIWWRRQGLNLRPSECKSGALPAELRPHYKL